MGRKNERAREREGPAGRGDGLSSDAPEWAQALGFDVRQVSGQKTYRCPGCDHEVRTGVQHLVVVPGADAEERRHWHTECWRSELRRLGIS
ncbi:MAG: hypothetical protein WD004_05020 [Actinomycetota bacterium]